MRKLVSAPIERISWTVFLQDAARSVYAESKVVIGRAVRQGWRPLFCFIGCYVAYFSYIDAPVHGVHVDYNAVNFFLSLLFGAFVTRGAEKSVELFKGGIGMGPGAASGAA